MIEEERWSGVEWRGEVGRRGGVGFTYSTIMIVRTGITDRGVTGSSMTPYQIRRSP